VAAALVCGGSSACLWRQQRLSVAAAALVCGGSRQGRRCALRVEGCLYSSFYSVGDK